MTIDEVHSDDADADHPVDRLRPEEVEELNAVCKLLGDKIRLEVVDALTCKSEIHVADLEAQTSAPSQPAISHHLGLMKTSGLLEARRDGKHSYYSISSGPKGQFARRVLAAWKIAHSTSPSASPDASSPPHNQHPS